MQPLEKIQQEKHNTTRQDKLQTRALLSCHRVVKCTHSKSYGVAFHFLFFSFLSPVPLASSGFSSSRISAHEWQHTLSLTRFLSEETIMQGYDNNVHGSGMIIIIIARTGSAREREAKF